MIKINGKEVKFGTFPNGEVYLIKESLAGMTTPPYIDFRFDDDTDLMKLLYVRKHLKTVDSRLRIRLNIQYMPYSRMDRENTDYGFLLKFVCDFINDMDFHKVSVIEPHSDVTMALLNNSTAVYPTKSLLENVVDLVEFDVGKDFLFFPDAGAQKRYSDILGYKTMVGFKQRDFASGNIERMTIMGNCYTTNGSKAIILDDLCSRGGTFMLAAKELEKIGVSEIYLLVSHCENTIFDGQLLESDLIKKVFTTNSIKRDEHEKIKVFKIGGKK